MPHTIRDIARLAALFSFILILACGCSNDYLMAPSNAWFSLVANPVEIPADGVSESTIEAFLLTPSGPVVDGTIVYIFTNRGMIVDENGNTVHQIETTGGLGRAYLRASNEEGTALVSVSSGSISDSVSISIGIQVQNISMSANPASFTVDDANIHSYNSTITATLWNQSGNPIDNKHVVFSADGGLMQSGGSSVLTETDGSATDQWTHSLAVPLGSSETFMITATSGSISKTISITITNTSE